MKAFIPYAAHPFILLIQFWIVCDMTSVFTRQSASGRHLKSSWLESGDHDNAQTAPVCSGTLSELSRNNSISVMSLLLS